MAEAANTVNKIRDGVSHLLDALETVPALNSKYVDLGGADFVKQYLLNEDGTAAIDDLTVEEFITGIANLQELLAWLDAGHRAALTKLTR